MELTTAHKIAILEAFGFTVGDRDPRLNTDYPGSLMVVEASSHDIDDYELPTAEGSDGPWCVVGDDLDDLVHRAYDDYLSSLDAPTFPKVLKEISAKNEADLPPRQNLTLESAVPTRSTTRP